MYIYIYIYILYLRGRTAVWEPYSGASARRSDPKPWSSFTYPEVPAPAGYGSAGAPGTWPCYGIARAWLGAVNAYKLKIKMKPNIVHICMNEHKNRCRAEGPKAWRIIVESVLDYAEDDVKGIFVLITGNKRTHSP